MENCHVTLTANAGVVVSLGKTKLWIDALHTQSGAPFSGVSAETWERLCESAAEAPPDVIAFTHCHPDHFSRELALEAKQRWPQARLLLPERRFEEQELVCGEEAVFFCGEAALRFIRLPHEGSRYADAVHYGLVVSVRGSNLLIPGDCALASPLLAEKLEGLSVELALLDFPWITLRRGRDFIRGVIRPRHLFVYHLPFAEDDRDGYRPAAEKAVPLLPEIPDVRLLRTPLQREGLALSEGPRLR